GPAARRRVPSLPRLVARRAKRWHNVRAISGWRSRRGGRLASVDIRLLGPVEAHHDGRRIGLGRRKERCLLGLLLLEAGRHVSIDRLVDLLWTDDPPAGARAAVHTSVARLRSRLAPYGVRLVSGGGGYAAEIDPTWVDVHRF